MASDVFGSFIATPDSFGGRGEIVPKGVELDEIPKAVVCLSAGDIGIVPANNVNDDALWFEDVPVGFIPPFRVRRVAQGTTCVVVGIFD